MKFNSDGILWFAKKTGFGDCPDIQTYLPTEANITSKLINRKPVSLNCDFMEHLECRRADLKFQGSYLEPL